MACSICHDAIDVDTTGRYETSCRHAFHLRCIAKWYNANSTCPLCRKEAVALERIDETSEEDAEPADEITDEMEREAEAFFLSFISQPLPALSPEEPTRTRVFPPDWFRPPPTPSHLRRPLPSSPIMIGTSSSFEAAANMAAAAAGALLDEGQAMVLRCELLQLLQRQGSRATVAEFFNEEDGQDEHTNMVTMTYESLNARLRSLKARPLSAEEFEAFRWGEFAI